MTAEYHSLGFMRGARNLRNGVYDDTIAEFVRRQEAAADYLIKHGILDCRFDRNYEGLTLHGPEGGER